MILPHDANPGSDGIFGKDTGGLRASTYQRMAEFLLPPDDPKRPGSLEKISSSFFKGLDTLGVRYERLTVPYGGRNLRALYFPGPQGAETKPLIMFGGGFDSILEEYYPNIAEAALKRGYSVLTYEGRGQGQALRKYGLTYTAEWEKPVAATLDEFLQTHPQTFEHRTHRHEHGRLFRAASRRL
jgi:predicted alpha/beta-fold hydrolase